ncbi:hypothetical protein HPB51_025913 [Rhipicephalus microplus]|uniref:Secreted protein n=1 Tax=Rhipicephalus microplus TaxID=6941 RepID=A0A9J6EDP5_RHIMP|nr:hypothetical protein HPB51_025913 [Rhipicephalus microplus]
MLNPFVFFAQIACCLLGPWLHSVTTLETTRSTATASTDAPKLRVHLTDGVLLSYHALPVLDSIVGFGSTSADSLRAHQSENVTTDHPVTERHWHVTSSTAGIKVLAALCFTSGQGGSSSSTMLNPFVFFAQESPITSTSPQGIPDTSMAENHCTKRSKLIILGLTCQQTLQQLERDDSSVW